MCRRRPSLARTSISRLCLMMKDILSTMDLTYPVSKSDRVTFGFHTKQLVEFYYREKLASFTTRMSVWQVILALVTSRIRLDEKCWCTVDWEYCQLDLVKVSSTYRYLRGAESVGSAIISVKRRLNAMTSFEWLAISHCRQWMAPPRPKKKSQVC